MIANGDIDHVREAYIKEYDTLRQESLQSMGNRTQIIAFGLGTIGVLIAATLTAPFRPAELVSFMFNFAIPAVSVLVYVAWFAEFERMVRAGRYMQSIEDGINATLARKVLSWEHDLERMRMGYAYGAVFLLFLGLAASVPVFTFFLQEQAARPSLQEWMGVPTSLRTPWAAWLATVVAGGFSLVRIVRRFKKFSKSIPTPLFAGDTDKATDGR